MVGLSSAAEQKISELLQSSVEPERASHYVDQFAARHPQQFQKLVQAEERLRWLITLFSFSRFLAEELLRHPDWIFAIGELDRTFSSHDYLWRLAAFQQEDHLRPAAFEPALFRRRELLRVVLRDSLNLGTLSQLTQEISNLADAILASVLDRATNELSPKYGTPQSFLHSGERTQPGFAVIALGKLGGCELNYSSDIDLMFVYGDHGETTGPQVITNGEFFNKIANRLTTLLSTYTAGRTLLSRRSKTSSGRKFG